MTVRGVSDQRFDLGTQSNYDKIAYRISQDNAYATQTENTCYELDRIGVTTIISNVRLQMKIADEIQQYLGETDRPLHRSRFT